MKKILLPLSLLALASALFTSCDDDVTNVGSSLITDNSAIVIDSAFTVTGHSVAADSVQSRTITQLIGRLNATGFGSLSSEIVTQFMPAVALDTAGVGPDDIESMEMLMFFDSGSFTGDSLAPLGLKVYPLTRQLPTTIYSNFNPAGYYNPSNAWATKIYTGNALQNDSLNKLSYRTIAVQFPRKFAVDFYKEYKANPASFATPQAFAKFFPGIYIQNSFGNGRITNIKETRVNLHFKRHDTYTKNDTVRDTVYQISRSYMAVTPEVVTNNIIRFQVSDQLTSRVNSGEAILVAPVGYNVELRFPLQEVIDAYRSKSGRLSVINTLTFAIPVESIDNTYGIEPPTNVLMVLKKDLTEFFAKNKLNDNETSFLAVYNPTTKCYEISDMRQYLINMLEKESITADDFNFVITPVEVTTETTNGGYYSSGATYTVGIAPFVTGPAMAKLNLDKAKIKLTFGKLSTN